MKIIDAKQRGSTQIIKAEGIKVTKELNAKKKASELLAEAKAYAENKTIEA
jgi:hypothetical protein